MQEFMVPYQPTIWAVICMALLMLTQVLVSDFVGISRKHKPGTPVDADHGDFHFRAVRALANTNESIAIFLLLLSAMLCIAVPPQMCNIAVWVFVAGRAGHMLCYYAGWGLFRSITFSIALIAQLSMVAVIAYTLLAK